MILLSQLQLLLVLLVLLLTTITMTITINITDRVKSTRSPFQVGQVTRIPTTITKFLDY